METSRNGEAQAVTPATLGSASHVIKAQELAPGWVLLYAVSFALALFCGAARATLVHPLLWVAFKLIDEPTALAEDLALALGYGPLALSFATLILPLGGWWWEQRLGGRAPSERERLVFEDALATLRQVDPELRPPRRWFVRDVHELNAAVYADTLMLTRGLLDSGYLEPVLAHELGHLNSSDARLTAAPPAHGAAAAAHTPRSAHSHLPAPHRWARAVGHPRALGRPLARPRAPRRPLRRAARTGIGPRTIPGS